MNPQELYDHGNHCIQEGQWMDAVQAFREYIAQTGGTSEAYTNMGLAYAGFKRFDLALEQWHKAVELNSDDSAAYFNMARAYLDMRKCAESEVAIEKALCIMPNEPGFLRLHGKILDTKGELEKAVKAYARALELEPNSFEACNSLGILFGKLGKIEDAVKSLESAIRIKPDNGGALANLALAYWQHENMEKARHYARLAEKQGGRLHPELSRALRT